MHTKRVPVYRIGLKSINGKRKKVVIQYTSQSVFVAFSLLIECFIYIATLIASIKVLLYVTSDRFWVTLPKNQPFSHWIKVHSGSGIKDSRFFTYLLLLFFNGIAIIPREGFFQGYSYSTKHELN